MTDNEGLRAKSRDELVDEIDARRDELQRRADEALEGLEKAFGPRESEARGPGRPKGAKNGGAKTNAFLDAPRGLLDAEAAQ